MGASAYNLSSYGEMIADRVRAGAFLEALRAVVRPGAVVMDIGTGPGIMAVEACRLGASRVFAIEPSEVIQVAREIAAANHCADKIEFFEDISTNITVPIRADVIISDLRGALPLFDHNIPCIADARRRFLAPGGTLIGRKDRIWVAIVEAPERYQQIVGPWDRDFTGQDLSPVRRMIVNDLHRIRATPGQLLTSPNLWATLDYTQIEDPDVQGELTWTVEPGRDRARDCDLVRCRPGRRRVFFERPWIARSGLLLHISALGRARLSCQWTNRARSSSCEVAGGQLFLAMGNASGICTPAWRGAHSV